MKFLNTEQHIPKHDVLNKSLLPAKRTVTNIHTYYIYKETGSRTKSMPTFTLHDVLSSMFSAAEINFHKALYVCWCFVRTRKQKPHRVGRNTWSVPENRVLKRTFGCKIFWSLQRKGGPSLSTANITKWRKYLTRSITHSAHHTSGYTANTTGMDHIKKEVYADGRITEYV
jgi:hypothetical protein